MSNQPKIYKYKDLSGLAQGYVAIWLNMTLSYFTLIMEQVKPVYL